MTENIKQTLYLKYRPKSFSELIGQEHISKTLQNAVTLGRISHAYLFSGPRGTGKTSTARLFAKLINCKSPIVLHNQLLDACRTCENCVKIEEFKFLDIIEVDAASNNSVDDIRQMREKVKFLPVEGKYKVYIIDEVHMLSTSAFNAFLKTLEEPPPNVIFILATTELHKVPSTIVSRCQCYEFQPIPKAKLVKRLKEIVDNEHNSFPQKFPIIDTDALYLIAEAAQGGFRDALSLLDQVSSYTSSEKVTYDLILEITKKLNFNTLYQLFSGIFSRNHKTILETLHKIYNSGYEPIYICKNILEYLHYCILIKSTDNSSAIVELPKENALKIYEQTLDIPLDYIVYITSNLERSFSNIKHSLAPHILLEIELLKLISHKSNELTHLPAKQIEATNQSNQQVTPTLANSIQTIPINATSSTTKDQNTVGLASKYSKSSSSTSPQKDYPPKDNATTYKIIINNISKSHKILGALLQQTVFVSYINGIVTIKALHSFLVSKINEPKNLEILKSFLEKELGKIDKIQIIDQTSGKKELSSVTSPNNNNDRNETASTLSNNETTQNIILSEEIQKIEQTINNSIIKKTEVADALEIFGGKVIKIER